MPSRAAPSFQPLAVRRLSRLPKISSSVIAAIFWEGMEKPAESEATRISKRASIHKRLYLDQYGTRAVLTDKNNRTWRQNICARQEDCRRVFHRLEPRGRHREHSHLIDRAESVLPGAYQSVAARGVTLKIEDCVDKML